MRVSEATLSRCGPLFGAFIEEMNALDLYRNELFRTTHDDRTLFSETLRILTLYHSDRCRAAYCLIVNGLVWDGEIIIRTFYETVAKVMFLSTASSECRETLLEEFWETLPAIYDRKGAEKAEPAKRLMESSDKDQERVFAALQNPSIYDLKSRGNKAFRKEIEQRWSFSKIIETLSRESEKHSRVPSIDALFHAYGMASHLSHASPKAIDLMEDRATRGDDLLQLEAAHISRMLSDMISLTCFSLYYVDRAVLHGNPMKEHLHGAFERFHAVTTPYQEEFDRSQDAFYENLLRSL